jgi:hypothetical protein
MYPASEIGGLFSEGDLPDAVSISESNFLRSGVAYGNTTNGIIAEGDVWARYSNGSRSERICLIGGSVQDLFSDSYKIDFQLTAQGESSAAWDGFSGDPPTNTTASIIVNRIDRCRWEGELENAFSFEGGTSDLSVYLSYMGEEIAGPGSRSVYLFYLSWFITNPNPPFTGGLPGVYKKSPSETQSSPIGEYTIPAEDTDNAFDSNEWIIEIAEVP